MRCSYVLLVLLSAADRGVSTIGDEASVEEMKAHLESIGVDSKEKRLALGGVAGMICGIALKKSQDMILNTALLGGVGLAATCYVGWVSPEQLTVKVEEAVDGVAGTVSNFLGFSKTQSVQKTIAKSKVALSNVAKRMPYLVGGTALGALAGYRLF